MSRLNFDKALEQEVTRLQLLHPTPSDIPGCLSAFDDYLACNGEQATRLQTKFDVESLLQSSAHK
jgi:hypothetical protein